MVQQESPFSHPPPLRSPTDHYPLPFLPRKRDTTWVCAVVPHPSSRMDLATATLWGRSTASPLKNRHWSHQLCCWQDLANRSLTRDFEKGLPFPPDQSDGDAQCCWSHHHCSIFCPQPCPSKHLRVGWICPDLQGPPATLAG